MTHPQFADAEFVPQELLGSVDADDIANMTAWLDELTTHHEEET